MQLFSGVTDLWCREELEVCDSGIWGKGQRRQWGHERHGEGRQGKMRHSRDSNRRKGTGDDSRGFTSSTFSQADA